jgi:hypothetical protein
LENAKKNLVFHFGVGRQASFYHIWYVKTVFAQSLFETKSWTFTKSFKLTVTAQRFGENTTFRVKHRSCKHCFKNEWTLATKKNLDFDTSYYILTEFFNLMIIMTNWKLQCYVAILLPFY